MTTVNSTAGVHRPRAGSALHLIAITGRGTGHGKHYIAKRITTGDDRRPYAMNAGVSGDD